ncbi:hypothetical protein GBA52_026884 [Prunus armeniaca]|nr:hypothetical protein GBA52_026884 [Prunus armeniaca]
MAQKDENVRQVTKRGGGQGSRGDQDQPAEIEVSITIHEEASTREERLKKLREEAPVQAQKLLMSSSQIHKELKKSIDDFVWRNSLAQNQNQQNPEAEPTHLLELLRTTMLGTSPSEKTKALGSSIVQTVYSVLGYHNNK